MKAVLQHIFWRKREYAKLPFFDFLRDESLPAVERLGFFPCMASFILTFGDLNKHVLRVEPTTDPFQAMLNAHTYEDDHHWPWYLEDYVKLGHDLVRQTPSETMRELWSDDTVQNRLLSHHLAHLIWGAEPVVRLAIVEAMEETGNVLFALTTELAKAVHRDSGTDLRYCGEFHFQLESGHAMNNDHRAMAAIELSVEQREDALQRVDKVYESFTAWTHELLRYTQTRHQRVAAGGDTLLQLHAMTQQLMV